MQINADKIHYKGLYKSLLCSLEGEGGGEFPWARFKKRI
jgi:hypothetical protein